MSLLSIPNVFATGTVINAAPFNANFNAVVSSVNNIDNTNIGAAGLYTTNFNPTTTAQATFGGAIGWTFTTTNVAIVPLTIMGTVGQGVNLFSVFNSSSTDLFHISASGRANATAGLLFPNPSTAALAPGFVELINDNAATGGLILNVPTGSTNGWQFQTNGTTVAKIAASGAATFAGVNVGGALTGLTGSLAITGNIAATGSIVAGSGTAGTATAGDLWASRSASTGMLNIGGSTSSLQMDWGITNAYLTFSSMSVGPVNISAGAYNDTSAVTTSGFRRGVQPGNGGTLGTSVLYGGTGVPSFSAPSGSIFLRYDGTTGARFYVNTSTASTSGTTWTAVAGV